MIVTTQEQLDAAIADGDREIVVDSPLNAALRARSDDRVSITVIGDSRVRIYGAMNAAVTDRGHVIAYDTCNVVADGACRVTLNDGSTCTARGDSSVLAFDRSTVIAGDRAIVHAYDRTIVDARGRAIVFAWGTSTVHASHEATVRVRDARVTVHTDPGTIVIDHTIDAS